MKGVFANVGFMGLVFIVILLFAAANAAAEPETFTIEVVSFDTGSPIQGSIVLLFDSPVTIADLMTGRANSNFVEFGSSPQVTDSDGKRSGSVEPGTYGILIIDGGYETHVGTITFEAGNPPNYVINMIPTTSVKLVISLSENIPDAHVWIERVGHQTGVWGLTDNNGEVTVTLEELAEYEIVITKEGYETSERFYTTDIGGSVNHITVLMEAIENPVENTPPSVDYIDLTPETPDKYDDLNCFIEVSDPDGDMDYVDIKWYVNGELVRENTRTVYGTIDTVNDVLSSFYTDSGDFVVCDARVYDFETASGYATHAIHVGSQPSNSRPTISYVEITPRQPNNPQQDLTCTVFATDMDDNLDYVLIEWKRNGQLIRQAAKNMDGSSDLASDILDWSHTYQGDQIACGVKVYDTLTLSNTDESLPVYIPGGSYCPSCPPYNPPYPVQGAPVAILNVDDSSVDEDETVYFSGMKSYDLGGYVMQYMFDYGDGTMSPWLSEYYSYHSYDDDGIYYARLKVKDNDYIESQWSQPVTIYVGTSGQGGSGDDPVIEEMVILINYHEDYVHFECNLDVYDRNGDLEYVRFKWYDDGDLILTEKDYVDGHSDEATSGMYLIVEDNYRIKCEATLYDEEHNSDSEYETVSGSSPESECKLTVTRFDYYSYFMEGNSAWVEINLENTGNRAGTLTVELYLDGSKIDQHKTYLSVDEEESERFEFPVSAGVHDVRVESYLPCGGRVVKTAKIHVSSPSSSVFIPDDRDEEVAGITETSFRVEPKSLDIVVDTGKTLEITMESPVAKTFGISVEGLPEGWASYEGSVTVQGRAKVYVYIVPKETGNYEFTVKAENSVHSFEETVRLYVAPAVDEGKEDTNGFTGLIAATQGNWVIAAAIISALVLLTVFYFVAGRFRGKTYEEHIYGKETPQPGMMKGSVGNPGTKRSPEDILSRVLPAEIIRYSDGTPYPRHGKDF